MTPQLSTPELSPLSIAPATGEFGKIIVSDVRNTQTAQLLQLGKQAQDQAGMTIVRAGDRWEFVPTNHTDDVIREANQTFFANLQQALAGANVEIGWSIKGRMMKQ